MNGAQEQGVSGRCWQWMLISVLLTAVQSGFASQSADPASNDTTGTRLTGAVSLNRLIDIASVRLGTQVEYDVGQLRAEVAIRVSEPIPDRELWPFVNSMLQARGRTTVRRDASRGLLSVVQIGEAQATADIERSVGGVLPPSPAGFRSVEVMLNFARAADVVSRVEPFLGRGTGSVRRVPGLNSIVVSDLVSNLDDILRIVAALDGSGQQRGLDVIPLRSLAPAGAIQAVTQLRGQRSDASEPIVMLAGTDGRSLLVAGDAEGRREVADLLARLDDAAAREVRLYNPSGFELAEVTELLRASLGETTTLGIVEDRLTNTLQILASPLDHDRIEQVLARLGEAPTQAKRPMRAIQVRNRDPQELVSLVQELMDVGGFDQQRDPAAADGGILAVSEPVPVLTARGEPEGPQLTVDQATSRIIAIAEPRQLDQIEGLVRLLDVRQPQVMLEVLLLTLSDGQSRDLGIELQALVNDAGTLVGLTSLFGLSSIDPTSNGPPLGSGSGGTAVVLDPGDFSAVIRAVENISEGRSLSMPKLLVNNAETANLDSVVQEPFLSTNASDTVATTSFGGTSDAGTQVSVTPQIAEGDHIVLQYAISLSSFTGDSADPALPPPRQDNSITSRATIPDGFTIAIGGIEVTTEAEGVTQVPVLGWIPGIGELFKSRSTSTSRSRFYAFIRANVLRDTAFEDLKYLSEIELDDAGLDDGWPVVEPRVIR